MIRNGSETDFKMDGNNSNLLRLNSSPKPVGHFLTSLARESPAKKFSIVIFGGRVNLFLS